MILREREKCCRDVLPLFSSHRHVHRHTHLIYWYKWKRYIPMGTSCNDIFLFAQIYLGEHAWERCAPFHSHRVYLRIIRIIYELSGYLCNSRGIMVKKRLPEQRQNKCPRLLRERWTATRSYRRRFILVISRLHLFVSFLFSQTRTVLLRMLNSICTTSFSSDIRNSWLRT